MTRTELVKSQLYLPAASSADHSSCCCKICDLIPVTFRWATNPHGSTLDMRCYHWDKVVVRLMFYVCVVFFWGGGGVCFCFLGSVLRWFSHVCSTNNNPSTVKIMASNMFFSLNMFLTLTAFIGGLAIIYYLTLPYPLFLPAVSIFGVLSLLFMQYLKKF